MIGRTISHYKILGHLGAGGMGVVYSAEDVRLGRPVGLKFVSEEMARDSLAIDRLRAEARAASALNHPGICTIYDVGEFEDRPYIVMELLKGQTLRDKLLHGSLKISQILDLGIQVADALDAAHTQGIIHRDIKPANLFVTDRWQVKILDFGLAKSSQPYDREASTVARSNQLTPEGLALGTVAYMSPEQASGEDLDGRSDLFSLGVVLYECATGRPPFSGKTPAVVLSAILNKAPVAPIVLNPELPLKLQDVITNCLEKDPELRYQAAAGLRADLKRIKRDIDSGHTGAITTATGVEHAQRLKPQGGDSLRPAGIDVVESVGPRPLPASRGRTLSISIAAALMLLFAGAATLWWSRSVTPNVPPGSSDSTGSPTETNSRSDLELARASLNRHDYAAALAQASAMLQASPGHKEATEIWEAARAAIAELEGSLAEAERRVAAGDAEGASKALDRARAIDPTAPRLAELSTQLLRLRSQTRVAATQPTPGRSASPASSATPVGAKPATGTVAEPASPGAPERTSPVISVAPQVPTTAGAPGPAPPQTASTPSEASRPPAESPRAPPASVSPPSPPPTPAPSPPAASASREPSDAPRTPAAPAPAEDDAAIQAVVATYTRAIVTKDLALFRSVKPNLSAAEERRLVEGFRAVSSQQVDITVLSIDRQGERATVRLRRRDTIQVGGRPQTTESQQSMALARTSGSWVILDIR